MPRLQYGKGNGYGISYSRQSEFNSCARKFQLSNILGLAKDKSTITFAFGHFVGAGVQNYFTGMDLQRNILASTYHWDMDFWAEGTVKEQRAKKSYWTGITAIEKFYNAMKNPGSEVYKYTRGYELAYFVTPDGKRRDGIELYFSVELYDGYAYEGHIDVVLYNAKKDEYMIVELKTTSSSNPHPAQYQNSDQALSYAVVLDRIADNYNANSAYSVLYVVYSTGKQEYVVFKFNKSVMQRAHWLNKITFTIAIMEMYRDSGMPWPTNGAACYEFFTPCEYLGVCNYTDEALIRLVQKPKESEEQFETDFNFDFVFQFDELIARQEELSSQRIGTVELGGHTGYTDVSDILEGGFIEGSAEETMPPTFDPTIP